ncbi:hypothetical protein CG736_28520 [Kitasatospora sp. CB02891]|nr:hypothetical protein CG736_28520 [Kitasatospora sp. CB02891]
MGDQSSQPLPLIIVVFQSPLDRSLIFGPSCRPPGRVEIPEPSLPLVSPPPLFGDLGCGAWPPPPVPPPPPPWPPVLSPPVLGDFGCSWPPPPPPVLPPPPLPTPAMPVLGDLGCGLPSPPGLPTMSATPCSTAWYRSIIFLIFAASWPSSWVSFSLVFSSASALWLMSSTSRFTSASTAPAPTTPRMAPENTSVAAALATVALMCPTCLVMAAMRWFNCSKSRMIFSSSSGRNPN